MKRLMQNQIIVFLEVFVCFFYAGCTEKDFLTTTTNEVSDITESTAVCGGTITADSNVEIMAYGICWSKNSNPTFNNLKTRNYKISNQFKDTLKNLEPGTDYYVRAYAISKAGVFYGAEKLFKTKELSVETLDVSEIQSHSAIVGGNITSEDGDEIIISRGVCYSDTALKPTIFHEKITSGSGKGLFTVEISNLKPSTLYNVRAFATRKSGTQYGSVKQFTTLDAPPLGSKVITLTVIEKSFIKLSFGSEKYNTPVWIEAIPGKFTRVFVSPQWSPQREYYSESSTISIYGNITSLDCSSVDQFFLDPGPVRGINLSGNSTIKGLECSENGITELDVSNLTELIFLDCTNNKLTSLNVSKNRNLELLVVSQNKLSEIDISNNTNLEGLYCSYNKLTSLNLSKNLKLTTIDCFNNLLTSLDVSKNTLLNNLGCFYVSPR